LFVRFVKRLKQKVLLIFFLLDEQRSNERRNNLLRPD
jgi:hypothetical protein